MSGGWKDVVKNGWHPEKSGTSLKSQVKGLVGRGDSSSPREERTVTPRSSLRDPSSFGPPPKHVAAYGRTTTSTSQTQPAAGAGASVSSYPPMQNPAADPIASQPYQAQRVAEEAPAEPEPRPYRVDTTGLSTAHLPPPPTRSSGAGSPVPTATTAKPKVPPSLPPRLPPRSGNSSPSPSPITAIEQAAGQGHLNQGAINRLGAAGISVPGLGIGARGRTPPPPTVSTSQAPSYGQVDELQARFARVGAPSSAHASSNETAATSVLGKKKPPPPPAPKKPELSGTRAQSADAPPPIPLSTRPRFD